MIILEKPYVSDFLIETIKKNNFSVLDNEVSRQYFPKTELVLNAEAINIETELFYSNSENSIEWILSNFKNSNLSKMIKISKNKALFREAIKSIYPDYYFKKVKLDDLYKINVDELKFPFVLKPTVGFLSFGVYNVFNKEDFQNILSVLKNDVEKFEGVFPKNVVDTTEFIIEEMIDGTEYALDAYFDENGHATILNIFEHPFFGDKDVSDRVYFTSKKIIKKHLKEFNILLDKIGQNVGYKNFPFHLELRSNNDKTIPIELNPLRFCGWCITDIAQYAWGINVYEYYMKNKKPDWNEILNNAPDDYFYFTIGDIPSSVNRSGIKDVDYSAYLKNISNPLDVRKIDYKNNPIFAIVFAKTKSLDEIKNILKLNMNEFIK